MFMQTMTFLVSCSHILDPYAHFRALKWGINFLFRSERLDVEIHRFLSEIGYQFQDSSHTSPPIALGL